MNWSTPEPPPDPAPFEWFWLARDHYGQLALFDAWPDHARDREGGHFPVRDLSAKIHSLDFAPTILARRLVGLPPAFARPVQLLACARAQADPTGSPDALEISERDDNQEGIALLELHAPLAEVPEAVLRDLARMTDGMSRLSPTRDSPRHGWLWTNASYLHHLWGPLGIERAWLDLVIPPAELGAFEYEFSADHRAYRCVGAPQDPVIDLEDLPPHVAKDFLELDVEFSLGATWGPDDPDQFRSLSDCLRLGRSGWTRRGSRVPALR